MQRIASFCVDHRCLDRGMYTSRVDGDVVTYDIRMKKPNQGDYLAVPALHTIEHLFATFARSSRFGNKVIYVGPMGCRTGFYLLSEGISYRAAFEAVRAALAACADMDEVPGAHRSECGNYREHDLAGAKSECAAYLALLDALPEEAIVAEEEKARRAEEGK